MLEGKSTLNKDGTNSVYILSIVWVALCASLVVQHVDLVVVFFSFIISFGLAFVIMAIISKKSPGAVKGCVGVLMCLVASIRIDYWAGGSNFVNFKGECLEGSSIGSKDFEAIGIVTGYLAFDLWYTQMKCSPLPSMYPIMEDTLTLTAFLSMLAKMDMLTLRTYRLAFRFWVAYKILRLVFQIMLLGPLRQRGFRENNEKQNRRLSFKIQRNCLATLGVEGTDGDITMCKSLGQVRSKSETERSGYSDWKQLWTIHGVDYDLSDFVHRHPGGKESIELGRGRDCTALFESYHAFTNAHRTMLQKYKTNNKVPLSDDVTLNVTKAEKMQEDAFYDVLKTRAAQTLRENGIDPVRDRCATTTRAIYYCFISLLVLATGKLHMKGNLVGSFLFAISGWLIGSLGHDGGHFAVSRIPWVNDVAVWGISLLCNPAMWQHQHTYAHHSHTNDFDRDPDLHHFEFFLRVHERVRRHREIYKYQSNILYVLFAYAFVVFGTCVKIPFGFLKDGSLYGIVEWTDRGRPLRALAGVVHFLLYISVVFIGPFIFSHRSVSTTILCVIVQVATAGLCFAFFSQINHLNEMCFSKGGNTDGKRNILTDHTSWAVEQIQTSNNFASGNVFWYFFSNGLNLQIEHHLFPALNHCHLHLIAPVVKQTCQEFGVKYKSYDSWKEVLDATLAWLQKLSN